MRCGECENIYGTCYSCYIEGLEKHSDNQRYQNDIKGDSR